MAEGIEHLVEVLNKATQRPAVALERLVRTPTKNLRRMSIEMIEIVANIERIEIAETIVTKLMSSFGDNDNELWKIGRQLSDMKRKLTNTLGEYLAS